MGESRLNKTEAVGADKRRSRHVITIISKNSGIDFFIFFIFLFAICYPENSSIPYYACLIGGINILFVEIKTG